MSAGERTGRMLAIAELLRRGYSASQVSELLKLTDAGKLDEAIEKAMRERPGRTATSSAGVSGRTNHT